MELILISYPDFFEGETKIVSSLLDRFAFTFHLRKPKASSEELENYLNEIPVEFHPKIIIHNSIEILNRFNLKGIHFSTSNRNQVHKISKEIYAGTSCHSLSEIKDLDGDFNYSYLSPIFPSISKRGYTGNLNLDEIEDFLQDSRQNEIIALGGIDSGKVLEIKNAKFDGLSVLGAIWTNDPSNNYNKILSNFTEIYTKIHL